MGTQGPVAVCLVKTTETAEASTHAFRVGTTLRALGLKLSHLQPAEQCCAQLHVARSRISDKLTTSESFEACRQAWYVE